MRQSDHDLNEDFPLSGGQEPDFKYGKQALIIMIIIILTMACLAAYSKGIIHHIF
jgi:hypothetical protein